MPSSQVSSMYALQIAGSLNICQDCVMSWLILYQSWILVHCDQYISFCYTDSFQDSSPLDLDSYPPLYGHIFLILKVSYTWVAIFNCNTNVFIN